ncbi:hypothetical protein RvY_10290-2 [Ramazzottius varieornatus]|nr:hypothetical protein RvY_10290-2 [Ramazzottius varieornatus]
MTISYQFNVHTASLGGFARLLLRWRGSVYKLVFKETIIFGMLYAIVSVTYRMILDEPQRRTFEQVARHVGDNKNLIPLTFILGFYVQFVVGRWWDQYNHYPWPDRILNLIVLYVNGTDERSRLVRRTLARWLCLSIILLTRGVSVVAKKRFPTLQHLIDAGLMTKEEADMFDKVNIPYAKYWVPMLWFTQLLTVAKRDKTFDDPTGIAIKQVFDEVAIFRSNQWKIWSFDWVSVPVVYTQVVTIATYVYFIGCLFSRQFLDPSQGYEHFYVDFYFPVFTFLQFFFYVGWLKVAESLINPWGEDDDDFEVNWFIDRHVQVAFLVVDEKFGQLPTLVKDAYWDTTEVKVPYTSASAAQRRNSITHIGSTMQLEIPLAEQKFLPGELLARDRKRLKRVATSPANSVFQRIMRPRERRGTSVVDMPPRQRLVSANGRQPLERKTKIPTIPESASWSGAYLGLRVPTLIMEASETNSLRSGSSSPEAEVLIANGQPPLPSAPAFLPSPTSTINVGRTSPDAASFITMKLDDSPTSEKDIVFPEVGFGTEVTAHKDGDAELLGSGNKMANKYLEP